MSLPPSTVGVDDEVRVFDVNGRRMGQPEGGWRGRVVKVGRKLVTITYGKYGTTEQFRMDSRRLNDRVGHRWFRNLADAKLEDRWRTAKARLVAHGVRLDLGHSLTLDRVEAIAAVLAPATEAGT